MNHSITLSFVSKLTQQSQDYYLVRGEADHGLPCWHIMQLTSQSVRHLNDALGIEVELPSIGHVIASGFGTSPAPNVVKSILDS